MRSLPRPRVPSLIRELRFQKLHGKARKERKMKKKNLDLHRALENSGISRGTDRRMRGFSSCKVMENFGYCAINVKSQGN